MKIALIDADSFCFIGGSDLGEALDKVDRGLYEILEKTNCTHYKIFIEPLGNNVFRKKLFKTYKGKRKPPPEFYKDIKEYITSDWDAFGLNGYESDDCIISAYYSLQKEYPFSDIVVCALDKDYKQYPIKMFDTYYRRFGQMYEISPEEAEYNFLTQMIAGDSTDNVSGVKGKGVVAASKLLDFAHNRFIATCRFYRQTYGSRWQKKFLHNYQQLRLLDNLRLNFELNSKVI